jgi:hypothetical protein
MLMHSADTDLLTALVISMSLTPAVFTSSEMVLPYHLLPEEAACPSILLTYDSPGVIKQAGAAEISVILFFSFLQYLLGVEPRISGMLAKRSIT